MLLTSVLASLLNRNGSKARQEIQARLHWGEQVTGSHACSLPDGFLIWSEQCVQGLRWRAGSGDLPTLRWCWVQGDVQGPDFVLTTLCLLLALQKWQLGFVLGFSLTILYLADQYVPAAHIRGYF